MVVKPFGVVILRLVEAEPASRGQESRASLMVTEIAVPPEDVLSGTGVPPGVAEEMACDRLLVDSTVPAGMGLRLTSNR